MNRGTSSVANDQPYPIPYMGCICMCLHDYVSGASFVRTFPLAICAFCHARSPPAFYCAIGTIPLGQTWASATPYNGFSPFLQRLLLLVTSKTPFANQFDLISRLGSALLGPKKGVSATVPSTWRLSMQRNLRSLMLLRKVSFMSNHCCIARYKPL